MAIEILYVCGSNQEVKDIIKVLEKNANFISSIRKGITEIIASNSEQRVRFRFSEWPDVTEAPIYGCTDYNTKQIEILKYLKQVEESPPTKSSETSWSIYCALFGLISRLVGEKADEPIDECFIIIPEPIMDLSRTRYKSIADSLAQFSRYYYDGKSLLRDFCDLTKDRAYILSLYNDHSLINREAWDRFGCFDDVTIQEIPVIIPALVGLRRGTLDVADVQQYLDRYKFNCPRLSFQLSRAPIGLYDHSGRIINQDYKIN